MEWAPGLRNRRLGSRTPELLEQSGFKEATKVAALHSMPLLVRKQQFEEVGPCQFGRSLLLFGTTASFLVTDILLIVLLWLLITVSSLRIFLRLLEVCNLLRVLGIQACGDEVENGERYSEAFNRGNSSLANHLLFL